MTTNVECKMLLADVPKFFFPNETLDTAVQYTIVVTTAKFWLADE